MEPTAFYMWDFGTFYRCLTSILDIMFMLCGAADERTHVDHGVPQNKEDKGQGRRVKKAEVKGDGVTR